MYGSCRSPVIPHKDGKIRGMRSTAELFLYIDVPAAMQAEFSGAHIHAFSSCFCSFFSSEDGMVFYRSKNEVILTQGYRAWKQLLKLDFSMKHMQ